MMKILIDRITKAFLLIVILCSANPAQESKLMWLGEYIRFSELPILQPVYSNYSELDLDNFRDRLKSLHSDAKENEWEGRFIPGGMDIVGISVLDLSVKSGFTSFYVYTCTPELRSINYGSVINRPDMVELVSEIPPGSPRKSTRSRLVKVKWGEHLYLVNEKSLAIWAEKAVGRYVPSQNGYEQNWADYWESGNIEAPLTGIPSLPTQFQYLSRGPVEASIISVRPRTIESEFSSGITYHGGNSAAHRVVINAGRNSGVKKDMTFSVIGTDDELTITKVGHRTSEGVVVRAIDDETQRDHCLTDDAKVIQCPTLKSGLKVSTIVGKFWM
ncbi:MAG TPA: hypothetical protein VK612_06560 [Pyrinomonadaceae bacterium]|nr:hypothetical protein [Pyrinomonadaceae bacterium]